MKVMEYGSKVDTIRVVTYTVADKIRVRRAMVQTQWTAARH